MLLPPYSVLVTGRSSLLVTRYSLLVARRCSVLGARRSLLVTRRSSLVHVTRCTFFPSCLLPFPHGLGWLEPGSTPGRKQAGKGDHHHPQDKGKDGVCG